MALAIHSLLFFYHWQLRSCLDARLMKDLDQSTTTSFLLPSLLPFLSTLSFRSVYFQIPFLTLF